MKNQFDGIHRGYTGCVYVAELADGLVKIGFSSNPKTRLNKLAYQVRRKFETTICRFYISTNLPCRVAQKTETEALIFAREIGRQVAGTLEYFQDMQFSEAIELIEQIAGGHIATAQKAVA